MESSSSSRPMTSKEAAIQDLSEENSEKPEHKNEEEKKEKKKRVKKITATDTFKCNLCPFMTGYLGMFERHVARHAEKKTEYKCAYCDKKFRDQLALNNHSNTHLGLKPYKCDLCESAFGSKSEADRHMRYRHTHEKPHKCPECSYSTVEKTKLKRHMRVHTKERPYICGFCEYASSDTFRLKRHMRIHTGEKPYECPHCKQSFAQCNTLKSHIKNHHSSDGEENKVRKYKRRKRRDGGEPRRSKRLKTDAVIESGSEGEQEQDRDIKLNNPAFVMVKEDEEQASEESLEFFKCTECFMKFLTKELFDEHYVKHTGERPYECEICKLKFGHKSALQAHKRSHDPDYYPVRLKQTKTRKKAVSDERDKENRETSTKEEKIEAESDEARESMRKCAPRSQSPLSRLMRVGADEEYQQCGETTIVNATFHVTGSPHRLFLLNAAQSSESSLECHVNTSSILFG